MRSRLLKPSDHAIQSPKVVKHDIISPSKDLTSPSTNESEYGPSKGWCAQWRQLSYNIKLILIYTLIWGASISIWKRQLLAANIFKIADASTEILKDGLHLTDAG